MTRLWKFRFARDDLTSTRCPTPSRNLPGRRTGGLPRRGNRRLSVRSNGRRRPRNGCCRPASRRRRSSSPPSFALFSERDSARIASDSSHPRLAYAVAPSWLVTVYISLRERRCVGDGRVGTFPHFYRGDLWWLWGKLVMFLVFPHLKLQKRVSARRERRFRGWTLDSAVFAHGILGERGNRNRNCFDPKESSEGSSEKFVPPSNIVNEGGMRI